MTIHEQLEDLQKTFEVLGIVNLDEMSDDFVEGRNWLDDQCKNLHRDFYQSNQRIIFTYTTDLYDIDSTVGTRLRTLQKTLNQIDITNCFVLVVSTNPDLEIEIQELKSISEDPNDIEYRLALGQYDKRKSMNKSKFEEYRYGSPEPLKISLGELDDRKKFLLTKSKTFCIYPWIHMHAYPTGEAWPCCHAEMAAGPVGNCRDRSLKEIWNSDRMLELRQDMLNEKSNSYCTRCYEQEQSGFFSGRQSANKHHGHHINRIDSTKHDGTVDQFEMTYWDIRFSNLCNLRCRSCGHIFSSQWYQDQVKLAGPEWAKKNKVLNYAGRTETDIWEQLIPHLDYVEQIYFAGGEPLLMEEHYNILEELERRGRFDVRLIYNTNFTEVKLKDRYVFDYWKKFNQVAVGASLDAMGDRAEYIRKGTNWIQVEENRRKMMEICPEVDFYISPTLSIMNAWHLPDFHRDWVAKGLLKPQDLNVNILQDPAYYRIDIAPMKYKQRLRVKFEEHLEWLRPQDRLGRATVGFESAINFMMGTDNTNLLPKFKSKTEQLDSIRSESMLKIIPELESLFDENSAP